MQRKKNEQVTNLKNKIKRLSKGDFHIPQPEIIFRRRGSSCVSEKARCTKEAFLSRIRERGRSVDWFIHRLFGYAVRSRDLMGIR